MKPPTDNEILKAIREAMKAPQVVESAPGVTTTEIAKAMGCSQHEARRHVVKLLANGTMIATRVRRRTMGGFGQPCEVPGYRLKT